MSDEEPKHEFILLQMKVCGIVAKVLPKPTSGIFFQVDACDPGFCIVRGVLGREKWPYLQEYWITKTDLSLINFYA